MAISYYFQANSIYIFPSMFIILILFPTSGRFHRSSSNTMRSLTRGEFNHFTT